MSDISKCSESDQKSLYNKFLAKTLINFTRDKISPCDAQEKAMDDMIAEGHDVNNLLFVYTKFSDFSEKNE